MPISGRLVFDKSSKRRVRSDFVFFIGRHRLGRSILSHFRRRKWVVFSSAQKHQLLNNDDLDYIKRKRRRRRRRGGGEVFQKKKQKEKAKWEKMSGTGTTAKNNNLTTQKRNLQISLVFLIRATYKQLIKYWLKPWILQRWFELLWELWRICTNLIRHANRWGVEFVLFFQFNFFPHFPHWYSICALLEKVGRWVIRNLGRRREIGWPVTVQPDVERQTSNWPHLRCRCRKCEWGGSCREKPVLTACWAASLRRRLQ